MTLTQKPIDQEVTHLALHAERKVDDSGHPTVWLEIRTVEPSGRSYTLISIDLLHQGSARQMLGPHGAVYVADMAFKARDLARAIRNTVLWITNARPTLDPTIDPDKDHEAIKAFIRGECEWILAEDAKREAREAQPQEA